MSNAAKSLEPAFQGVGQKAGLEIWRIENFQPVPLPKPDYGKFYSGDSYIVLQTIAGRGGGYHYDVHFWLGKDTSQDEAGTAAIKTVELDAVLGGRAVQYRELQGHESDKFLSYFKPCIIPLEGGVASGFKTPEEEEFETRLYICKGKRVVRLKQVPFSRSSLNHDDIFILDTENKIYQFNGANSNIQERGKALEVVQFLKDKYHEGTCDVAIVDDGKLKAESDSGEFWVLFGGFAPIGKKVITDDDVVAEKTSPQLYSIKDGHANPVEGELSKSLLENNRCYLLDCGNEIFLWVGRVTQIDERKASIQAAEEFVTSQNRPKSTQITRLIQGHENHAFKSKFDSWPMTSTTAVVEEGRGKVAALLKQQGGGVKAATKNAPVFEDVIPPLLAGGGKLEVWRINGSEKTAVPAEDIGKFYSGDCYVVLYTYHHHERKEDFYLCSWIGKDSVQEEAETATRLCNTMYNTLKGRPVQGRIYQGKEPPQFIAIFQPMVTLKGGMSSGYKDRIAERGVNDETYTGDGVALFRISGTSLHNNKALQVDAVATSLNSNECFVLQSGTTVFCWIGNQSTVEQQQLAAKVAEFLKPGSPIKHTKEGTESSIFWGAVGGKKPYTSKKSTPEGPRDPHLFAYSFHKGKFEVEEIYRFSQDDLLTEDMLILDTRAEVVVWVGQLVDPKEKQTAFEIGQTYVEMAASLDGLAPNVPLYKVAEGNEPCFFTTYFSWDPAKASLYGNSFQKKVLQLFGYGNEDKSNPSNNGGPTQRASALAALNNAFNSTSAPKPVIAPRAGAGQGSQRAAAVAALSSVLTAEKRSPDSSPVRRLRSPHAEASPTARTPRKSADAATSAFAEESKENLEGKDSEPAEPVEETNEEESDSKAENEQDEAASEAVRGTYSYEQLKSKATIPGVDYKRREAYLSDEEFETVFEMSREAFYQNPKWKQDLLKKKADLF
ncbi:villin-2-like [Salvia miltiorrhiza]|uniref:villin-2-like n=1 Tax=Salvia miltiorrhiza TaxID=226208 RepID=UPI0025AC24E2|nr:villin-2-like [Salvia miltiorrhiza]XP_057770353.1 villin-2-like [Salvia miltiorrhiza]XP_057770354.1 villin-2-like [Salvia miltiorrhiza]